MSKPAVQHRTVVLGRAFDVPVARLYAVLSEPAERARLCAIGDDIALAFDELDFRVGGREMARFGPEGTPRFRLQSIFQDIVPEGRIVSTDTVLDRGTTLSIAVATWEMKAIGNRSELKLTAQVAYLDHADTIDGADAYYEAVLAGLGRLLGEPARPRHRPFAAR